MPTFEIWDVVKVPYSDPVVFSAMGYLSIDEGAVPAALPYTGGLSISVPGPSKFALSCLSVGIGDEGRRMVAGLASAPWFSHLRSAAQGPFYETGREGMNMLNGALEQIPGPHVVSVALPCRPDQAEVDAACAVGYAVRERNAFTVATVSQPSSAAMVHLGGTFDCLIQGDGGVHHHWYPARTVTEPAGGRPICYDLYDVCTLWAGRVGSFGVIDPTADAWHVEVSAENWSLAEVDRLVSAKVAGLAEPSRLRLFNVVIGAQQGATAVSFSDSELLRQQRAAARR